MATTTVPRVRVNVRASIILLALGAFALAGPARAQLLVYEGFDYAAGAKLEFQSGGTGWPAAWLDTYTDNSNIVRGRTLSYTDGSGNALATSGTTALYLEPSYHQDFRMLPAGLGAAGTSLWFSVLARKDQQLAETSALEFLPHPADVPALHLGEINGSSTWRAGIWTGSTYLPGTFGLDLGPGITSSVFLVGRIDFGTTTDNYYFWANPALSTVPTDATAKTILAVTHLPLARISFQAGFVATTPSEWDELRIGNSFADVAPIAAHAGPTITQPPANPSLCNSGSATLWVDATGTAPLHYAWYQGTSGSTTTPAPGATDSSAYTTPTLSSTTTYWVRLTNTYGTADSPTATVTVTPTPSINAANDGPSCVGSTAHLTTTTVSAATYAWTGPNGFTSTTQNPTIPGVTTAATGTYSVTATANGCISNTATTTLTVNTVPATPTAANDGPICSGSTLHLTTPAVTGATYAWTGPNGFTSTAQNPSITGAGAAATGTYSVTVTVNACASAAGTTAATVNQTPTRPTATNDGPACTGGTAHFTASTIAGATYSWSGPNGFTSTDQNPSIANVTSAAAGTYSVTATVNGCTSNVRTSALTVRTTPATPSASSNGPICQGSTLSLTTAAVTGATYSWSGPNGFTSTSRTPSITAATTAATGTYSVTVTVNGCTSAAGTTSATVSAIPTATPTNDGPLCAGATLHLATPAVTGATYSWTGPNGFTSTQQNPSIASVTAAASGTYSVTVTTGGCTPANGTTSVTVNPDTAAPTVTAPAAVTVDQSLCCGTFGGASPATSAALSAFVSGGTASDDCDSSPAKLAAQAGGVDVASATCFQAGATAVTFRFQDSSGKTGTATASATVRMFGDLNLDASVDPSDMVILRAYFNFVVSPGTPPFNAPLGMADLSHDTVVDPSDSVILRAYFNFVVGCLAP